MVGDHITPILAGDYMVAKVIKCTTRAQITLGALRSIKAKPPFDGNLENRGIRVKPQASQRAQQKARLQHGGKKLTKDMPCLLQKMSLAVS